MSFLKTTAEQQVWNIPEYLQLVLPFIYLIFFGFFFSSKPEGEKNNSRYLSF